MGCCSEKCQQNCLTLCSEYSEKTLLNHCFWFRAGKPRNSIIAIVSGVFFFSGWWVILDAAVNYGNAIPGAHYVIGVIGTFSFIMINIVTSAHVTGDGMAADGFSVVLARFWLFVGFILGFACLIASIWIFIVEYVSKDVVIQPGIQLFFHNLLVFLSSMVFKFGKKEDEF